MTERDKIGFRYRGWIGVVVLVPLGVASLLSAPFAAEGTTLDIAVKALAWPVFLLGALLRFWSTLYIGGRKRRTLVAEGPYSLSRNPLYLGSFLLALAGGLFLESLTVTAGVGVAALLYALGTVPAEEQYLAQALGAPYEDYCRRVPRYWPRWTFPTTATNIEVDVPALQKESLRAVFWIWIPLLGEILGYLRSQPWWPHVLRLP